jgi:hypothetical protein
MNIKTDVRVKLDDWMTNALYRLSRRTGMDYTNLTRMALMEYIEKRLSPLDYEHINKNARISLRNAIFEFEHYNRITDNYSEKKAKNFKKLFIVALQNYKKLKNTIFKDYKTNINRFSEIIWKEPGVIDLLDFFTELDETPLPEEDQYEHLLKDGKEDEYYNKKWVEIYNILKNRIGREKHENYARLIEMKIDHGLVTDTDAMYFLFELLKNNKPLPPSSGQETKRLRDVSMVDEGLLEELIEKYGTDFTFNDTEELEESRKKYGWIGHIDYMIKHHQEGVKAYKDQKDQCDFEKEQLEVCKKMREEFMKEYLKPGAKPIPIGGKKLKKDKYAREKELAKKMIEDPDFGIDDETMKQINIGALDDEIIKLHEEKEKKKRGKNAKKKKS